MALASTSEYLTELVRSALDAADDLSVSVSAVARKALRVARLRNDWEAQWWLQLEMSTVTEDGPGDPMAKRMSQEIAAHLTPEEHYEIGERVATRWMEGPRASKTGFQGRGIPDAEAFADGLEAQIAGMVTPEGLHPVDLYHRSEELLKVTAQLNATLTQVRGVLARQRFAIADYLSEVERQLLFGQINSDIFERNRKYVEQRLAEVAPEALEQFSAAYRRQAEGDAEARSHALTSCRRVLKTLADALYPPTNDTVEGVDGRERKMTDDKFIVRLCQFATEKREMGTASRELLKAQIKTLGERLDSLNSISSKGVHDNASAAEVDQCLIQTYLTVGDLLRLADDRSAALSTSAT